MYTETSNVITENITSLKESNPILEMTPYQYNPIEEYFIYKYSKYFNEHQIFTIFRILKSLQNPNTQYRNLIDQKHIIIQINCSQQYHIEKRINGNVNIITPNENIENIKIPFDYFYNLIAYKNSKEYLDIIAKVDYIKDNLYTMIKNNGCGIIQKQKKQISYQWCIGKDVIFVCIQENKSKDFEIIYRKHVINTIQLTDYYKKVFRYPNHTEIMDLIKSQEFYQKQITKNNTLSIFH